MSWSATCGARTALKCAAIPTSAATWWHFGGPRFRRTTRRRIGGRESGDPHVRENYSRCDRATNERKALREQLPQAISAASPPAKLRSSRPSAGSIATSATCRRCPACSRAYDLSGTCHELCALPRLPRPVERAHAVQAAHDMLSQASSDPIGVFAPETWRCHISI